jgi:glycosyltransferase involved in cell wall biosynthesis
MKINWFSPLPPLRTEIANNTMRVIETLAQKAEVILWTEQEKWSASIDRKFKVITYDHKNINWKKINEADITIYNMGNNPTFHYGIWKVSQQFPGIMILHDIHLQHFFEYIYRHFEKNMSIYSNAMELLYGKNVHEEIDAFNSGKLHIDILASKYPLTSHGAGKSHGVIIHNSTAYDDLCKKVTCPVACLDLPFDCKRDQYPLVKTRNYSRPIRLILFGHIHTNRRLDSVLLALSKYSKDDFRLDIYGDVSYPEELDKKIKELSLTSIVKVHNFVSDSELENALSKAHLAINLRYPTMGEASSSQLKIWSFSLPSLVTKVGWYSKIPDTTVKFVTMDNEINDIQRHLDSIVKDPRPFIEMGKAGFELLMKIHTTSKYARDLVDFSKTIIQCRKRLSLYSLTDRVGNILSRLPEHTLSENYLRNVSQKIVNLFEGNGS